MDSFSRVKKLTSNIIEFMNLNEQFSKEIDDSKLFQSRDILPQIPQLPCLDIAVGIASVGLGGASL